MKISILCGLSALFAGTLSVSAQSQTSNQTGEIELAKQKIAEFVKTRQLIATRRTEWTTYRDLAQRRLEAFRRELADLEADIVKAENETSQAELEISERQNEIDRLNEANKIVLDALPAIEDRILNLSQYFPKPLKDRVEPLMRNLGKGRQASERMSLVIGVMNEFDRFNSSFNISSDQKTLGSGETVLVNVLYVGMGIAYYANENATVGGFGVPAKGNWQWTEDNSNAAAIRRMIAYFNNEVKPAQLVELPVFVTDIK